MVSPPLIPHCPVQHFEGRPGIGQKRILSWILTSPFESDPTLSMPAPWAQGLDGTESFSSIARRLLDDLPLIANPTTQGTAFSVLTDRCRSESKIERSKSTPALAPRSKHCTPQNNRIVASPLILHRRDSKHPDRQHKEPLSSPATHVSHPPAAPSNPNSQIASTASTPPTSPKLTTRPTPARQCQSTQPPSPQPTPSPKAPIPP